MYFSTRTILSTFAMTLLATSVAAAPAVANTPDLSGRQCRKPCRKEDANVNATTTVNASPVISTPDLSVRQCRKPCRKEGANATTITA
ncbi:hypothetical protein CTheo_7209 [Ceratobasidium theobromae]|uniref:Effector protein n=1 Tax=Ceratobasidium theobromae TaxID=1582974 RepID=A0A5N5QC72_9AGAM|nr:hypothetical protein CTheo_7209 [Ceratobasidium theobromae]